MRVIAKQMIAYQQAQIIITYKILSFGIVGENHG